MNISGYSNQGLSAGEFIAIELAEITLLANPKELREIASFLNSSAESMERTGASYSHEHLSDRKLRFGQPPHFTVSNAEFVE